MAILLDSYDVYPREHYCDINSNIFLSQESFQGNKQTGLPH